MKIYQIIFISFFIIDQSFTAQYFHRVGHAKLYVDVNAACMAQCNNAPDIEIKDCELISFSNIQYYECTGYIIFENGHKSSLRKLGAFVIAVGD